MAKGKWRMNKIVIGIDQSYDNTGISICIDGEIVEVLNVQLNKYKTNTSKRRILSNALFYVEAFLKDHIPEDKLNDYSIICIIERIRLQSQGFLNFDYIKGIGALNAVIVDHFEQYDIPVYSVDTRSWKSNIVGSSKPMENEYGLPEEKFPTILYCVKHGYKKYIIDYNVGRKKKGIIEKNGKKYTYDNDKADAICISLYGFLPEKKQKLELEH